MSRTVMAHIEKVIQTYPIDGADKIEMSQILDYHVVTKKNEFKTGDLAVYVEVDSILPDGLPLSLQAELDVLKKQLKKATGEDIKTIETKISEIVSQNTKPEFEFLRAKSFRIKVQKYSRFADKFGNPIISQGILFPLSVLPQDFLDRNEGVDVTSILGVTKVVEDEEDEKTESSKEEISTFEKFLDKKLMRFSLYRRIKKEIKGSKLSGSWLPIFPEQSDEIAAQKCYSKILEVHGKEGYYKSSKIEGSNFGAYYHSNRKFFGFLKQEHFGVCTHHRHILSDDGSHFWKTARQHDFEKRLKDIGRNLFVRGEIVGGRIQGNIYKLPEHHIYLFEIYDMDNKRYFTFDEFKEFCHKYGFETVPILDENFTLPDTVQEILQDASHMDELVPGVKVLAEGAVYRKKDNVKISFKVRDPKYLALHGK